MKKLRVGDKIDVGYGHITELKEIIFCPYAKINLYWFYNNKGEYKFNVRDAIKKCSININFKNQ